MMVKQISRDKRNEMIRQLGALSLKVCGVSTFCGRLNVEVDCGGATFNNRKAAGIIMRIYDIDSVILNFVEYSLVES